MHVIAQDRVALLSDLQPLGLEQSSALDEARRGVLETDADALINRRTLPIFTTATPGSLPAWATGLQIQQTLGPFLDSSGQRVWIDIFRPLSFVRLVRS